MKQHTVFYGLTLVATLLMILSLGLQYVTGLGFQMDRWLFQIAVGLFMTAALGILMICLLLQMAMSQKIKKDVVLIHLRRILIGVFSLFFFLKPLIKGSYGALETDFVRINNQLVLNLAKHFKTSEILILTPHCLQNSQCPIKVAGNVDACETCGLCRVGDLKELKQTMGIDVVIATGGTLARKTIAERKPKLILAVACERDLVSGIMDTRRMLTYGIVNQRPLGPCLDTTVQMDLIHKALAQFTKIQ